MGSFSEGCDSAKRGRPMRSKARAKAEDKNRDKRSTSPDASSISGSVKARRWWSWWWWTFVERIETFCSPENAVDVLEKNEYEDDKARAKGKAIQDLKEEKDDLEKNIEGLRSALRTQEGTAGEFSSF